MCPVLCHCLRSIIVLFLTDRYELLASHRLGPVSDSCVHEKVSTSGYGNAGEAPGALSLPFGAFTSSNFANLLQL
ncbi:hypothetical protein BDV24DRAFT_146353, partial [Aspergillus arachidicola]